MTAPRLGWAMMAALVAFAVLAPFADPIGPFKQALTRTLSAPDASAPFGYDHLGRSMYARLAHALRLSLLIAFAATATAAAIGILLGALASWRGGWIDRAICLLADSVLALPALLMVLMMGVILPSTPLAFWAGLAAVQWIEFFRLTRSAARSHLASPAVEAARLQGFGPVWIFRHILWPEIGPMLRTATAFGTATAIAAIAALGFVSVGMRAPTPELGLMMVELLPSWREAPFVLLQPVLACFALLLSLNLIAGGRK